MKFWRRRETYEQMRRRLIRETEAALEFALDHPEFHRRIPVVESGVTEFDPALAERYWTMRLGLNHPPGASPASA